MIREWGLQKCRVQAMGMGVCGRGGMKMSKTIKARRWVSDLCISPPLPIASKTTPHHLH